jgi:hypothetical protein
MNMRDRVNIAYLLLIFEFFGMLAMHAAPRNDLYFAIGVTINALMLKALERGCRSQIWFDIFRLVFAQFIIQFVGWFLYRFHVYASSFYNPAIYGIVTLTFVWLTFGGTDDKHMARPRGFWLLFGDFGVGNKASARHP